MVDYRTDGCAGRDEKDVGVRSCSCGVAEKKSAATRWLTGTAEEIHAKSGTFILFGMARYKSCARARMVLSTVGIVQQQVNGMPRYGKTEGGKGSAAHPCSPGLFALHSC